jgi:uncharacterized protein YutE (UPF0331/DUF86 family)
MRTEVIRTKNREIDENLKIIKEHLPENVDEFLNLGLMKDGIYKRIESSIENIIDICAIINTDLDLGIPESDESILDNVNLPGMNAGASGWSCGRAMKAL